MWKIPLHTPIKFNWPEEDILVLLGSGDLPESETEEEEKQDDPGHLKVSLT